MFGKADRWAITKRRILHRDISPANILIRPAVPSDPRDGAYFIRGVLDPYVGFLSVGGFWFIYRLQGCHAGFICAFARPR